VQIIRICTSVGRWADAVAATELVHVITLAHACVPVLAGVP